MGTDLKKRGAHEPRTYGLELMNMRNNGDSQLQLSY